MKQARSNARGIMQQKERHGTCLCWLQNSPRDSPGMLKEARVVHPSILQWGWTMSIMPGSLCLLQNLPFCSPRWLNLALILHPSDAQTRTMVPSANRHFLGRCTDGKRLQHGMVPLRRWLSWQPQACPTYQILSLALRSRVMLLIALFTNRKSTAGR